MRKIEINVENKDYILELNRESIKWLEERGFSMQQLEMRPVTYYDILFASLFIANHKDVHPNLALKIMESAKEEKYSIADIVKFAIEEYESFIDALSDTELKEKKELKIIEA